MLMPAITFEEAIELASSGAKVLHPRAAEICMEHQVPIHVRSSFHRRPGTWIVQGASDMERPAVVGVTGDRKIAKVSLLNVPDEPGTAARIFEQLAVQEVNIRLIIQSAGAQHRAGITFITDADLVDRVVELIPRWKESGLASDVEIERAVAKIAIVGSRLSSTPGLAARMFAVLGREGINIDCISSSEMKIACIVAAGDLDRAVRAVHGEFFGQPAAGESVA
jgi:aspartate kinase